MGNMNSLSLTAWCAAFFAGSALFGHNVALRLVLLALGLACAAVAAARHRRELQLVPSVWWPFLLWAAWTALSLTWSIEPERSDKEFRNEIVYVGLAFLVCYIGAQAPRSARAVMAILGSATALLCVVAFHSYLQGIQQYLDAWHGGPGDLSSALLVLLPCVLAAGWYVQRIGMHKALAPVAMLVLLILVAAYTTLNRTIWFGFVIEIALLGTLIAMRNTVSADGPVRRSTLALAIAVLVSCVGFAALVQLERQESNPQAVLDKDPRLSIWPDVVRRIEAAPLTGYGFGRGLLRHDLTRELGNGQFWHAHNLFLDIGLQTGIPGLLLFLLLIGVIVGEGWRASRHGADDRVIATGMALLGVIVGMVVRNMTDTLLVRQNSLFFWATVGFLLGWIERRPKA